MCRGRSLILLLLVAPLAGFADFTEVQDVCPTCNRPTNDVVVLKTGAHVWCNVIAANEEYYVLERFGEVRAALRDEVKSVHWGPGRSAASLESGDQILLKNDVLYHGQILSEEPGLTFSIQCPQSKQKQTPSVFMIKSVHKAGQTYHFKQAAPPPSPAPTKAVRPPAPKPAAPAPSDESSTTAAPKAKGKTKAKGKGK